MVFTDEFMESLPTDMVEAGKKMCNLFFEFNSKASSIRGIGVDNYLDYMDYFAAIEGFAIANNIMNNVKPISLGENKLLNIGTINEFVQIIFQILDKWESSNVLESARNRYKTYFENSFSYKFTEGDIKQIQTLINTLRDLINESTLFEDNHRTRLLNRLEKLQKELHKKMSNIDVMWGFIGDAGVVIGKFGADAKPFIDIIKEITQIAWRTQATAEELPSGTSMPMLNE